jgi:hypothetical protein
VLKFAVIAEGPCDQIVIENILLGYFQDEAEDPVVNYLQPPPTTGDEPAPPGGWTLVLQSLRRGDVSQALQFNDYVIVHIDTDKQDDAGFDVPRRKDGAELSIEDRIASVIGRLTNEIDGTFYQAYKDQVLFAIAVDSTECWLLPLLLQNKKAAKTTGCLAAANNELRKANKKGLASQDGCKFSIAYDEASREYRKRKTLEKHRDRNPSLSIFVKSLDEVRRSREDT